MHPKHQEVISLRMKGNGYGTIAQTVGVSKNSVSRWCRNLTLPQIARKKIEARIKYTKNKFVAYNRRKHQLVENENKKIRKHSFDQIRPLSRYELLLVGSALYWGEGYKNPRGDSRYAYVQISNSDPSMIKLYLRFLREVLHIPEEKFCVSVRIYSNIDKQKTIKFWSKATKIPQKRFNVTYQISRASKRKRPYNTLPYGTLDLRVNKRQNFFQIKGWIDGLIGQNSTK